MALVAQGFNNKEMAEKMFISELTVNNHLDNIFDKLGVSDRVKTDRFSGEGGSGTPVATCVSFRLEDCPTRTRKPGRNTELKKAASVTAINGGK